MYFAKLSVRHQNVPTVLKYSVTCVVQRKLNGCDFRIFKKDVRKRIRIWIWKIVQIEDMGYFFMVESLLIYGILNEAWRFIHVFNMPKKD